MSEEQILLWKMFTFSFWMFLKEIKEKLRPTPENFNGNISIVFVRNFPHSEQLDFKLSLNKQFWIFMQCWNIKSGAFWKSQKKIPGFFMRSNKHHFPISIFFFFFSFLARGFGNFSAKWQFDYIMLLKIIRCCWRDSRFYKWQNLCSSFFCCGLSGLE